MAAVHPAHGLARAAGLLAVLWGNLAGAAPATEYQVKAAYLFNFGQFVEWPSEAWSSPDAPFAICVVGDDPFGRTLDDVAHGESINGRPLLVRRLEDHRETAGCNILFIARSESARLAGTLEALKGRNLLTVTDIEGAESAGAVIVLVSENNRIRMRINVAAAKANHLVISSKLLRPAEVVGLEAS